MAKIISNPQINPQKAFESFSKRITTYVNKKKDIKNDTFYSEFKSLATTFEKDNKGNELIKVSRNLIEFLVNKGKNNLAEIAYSILIKLNKNNPKVYETLVTNGLALAKRGNDPVHIMARAGELAKIYEQKAPGGSEHVKYLRLANKSLGDICKNYSNSVATRYQTITRELKPLENYELALCSIKLDIAKYTYKNELHNAKYELAEAKKLLEKNRNSVDTKKIQQLSDRLSIIESEIKSNENI